MRKRIAWVVLAVALVAATVTLSSTRSRRQVTMEVLQETNGCRTVIVRNETREVHHVAVWAEFRTNSVWEGGLMSPQQIQPHESITLDVKMPEKGKRRVTLWWQPHPVRHYSRWTNRMLKWLGVNRPTAHWSHVEVEDSNPPGP